MAMTDTIKVEPTILDGSMTKNDLVFMLENLHFPSRRHGDASKMIEIDKQVRDFLVTALKR